MDRQLAAEILKFYTSRDNKPARALVFSKQVGYGDTIFKGSSMADAPFEESSGLLSSSVTDYSGILQNNSAASLLSSNVPASTVTQKRAKRSPVAKTSTKKTRKTPAKKTKSSTKSTAKSPKTKRASKGSGVASLSVISNMTGGSLKSSPSKSVKSKKTKSVAKKSCIAKSKSIKTKAAKKTKSVALQPPKKQNPKAIEYPFFQH